MSKNLAQIYAANPVTTIGATDLLYVDVAGTTDAGINGANLVAQLAGPFVSGTGLVSAQSSGNDASGDYSIAFGLGAVASGNGSFAMGQDTANAAGAFTMVFGDNVSTNPSASFCLAFGGAGTSCNANYALAFGSNSQAAGDFSLAFGAGAVASGTGSFAIGGFSAASEEGSFCFSGQGGTAALDTGPNQFVCNFSGGYFFTGGSFNVNSVGTGLAVAEGSNAKQGIVTLAAGIGVVANTSVTANSRIFYNGQDTNVTGFLRITARTIGSGFTITSSVLTDTGVVAYEIFEPAV